MKLFWPIVITLIILSFLAMLGTTYSLSKPSTALPVFTEPVPTEYCWNRVVELVGGPPYWPDGCNTVETAKDDFCAEVITELSQQQILEYEGWKRVGKPALRGCS